MSHRRRRHRKRRRRAPRKGPVAAVLASFSAPLIGDSQAFSGASAAFAQAPVGGSGDAPPTGPTPEQLSALDALAAWQQEVQRAQARVQRLASNATGKALALQWLTGLGASLGLLYQSVSLLNTDPQQAATNASAARQSFEQASAVADRLEKAIA